MPLSVKDGMKTWIDDFQKSDNPKFKGKSAEKRREMAIAAYMAAKREGTNEAKEDLPFEPDPKAQKGTVTDKSGAKHSPMSRARDLARRARDAQKKDEGYVSHAQRKAVWANRADGGKGHPDKKNEAVEENVGAPQTAAHRRAQLPKKVKLKGFGPDGAKGNMGNPSARAALKVKESVELDEAHAYSKAANALRDYANKHGGMDKKDFHTAAKHLDNVGKAGLMQKGQHLAKMNAHFKGLDTDVRDRIHMTLKQHGVMEAVQVDELKKSTLGNYVKVAAKDAAAKAYGAASAAKDNRADQAGKDFSKSMKRLRGIDTATKKLSKEGVEEAKSFDQKFRDHLKFAVSKSPAVQAYMKKRAADRDAMNKKNDPNAAKKGYALSAVPPERAFKKARKKGMSASDASQAVGTASRNRGRKLPK